MAYNQQTSIRFASRHRVLLWRSVLVLALLFAQSLLLIHQADIEGHQGLHTCDVCVQASALGHADLPGDHSLVFIPAQHSIEVVAALGLVVPAAAAYIARAPPRILPI